MAWKCEIRKAENGFIVETHDENDDGRKVKNETAFQEKGDSKTDEQRCMKEMFLFVKEYFAEFYSKHEETNLEIKIIDKNNKEVE